LPILSEEVLHEAAVVEASLGRDAGLRIPRAGAPQGAFDAFQQWSVVAIRRVRLSEERDELATHEGPEGSARVLSGEEQSEQGVREGTELSGKLFRRERAESFALCALEERGAEGSQELSESVA